MFVMAKEVLMFLNVLIAKAKAPLSRWCKLVLACTLKLRLIVRIVMEWGIFLDKEENVPLVREEE